MQCLWLRGKKERPEVTALITTKSSWFLEPLQQIIGELGHYNIANTKLVAFAYKHLDLERGSV